MKMAFLVKIVCASETSDPAGGLMNQRKNRPYERPVRISLSSSASFLMTASNQASNSSSVMVLGYYGYPSYIFFVSPS